MEDYLKEKIQQIDEYIDQLNKAITEKDSTEAERLVKMIIAVYENEIDNIANGLDNYSYDYLALSDNCNINNAVDNYIKDAITLMAKLKNYKSNLQAGLCKTSDNNQSINITNDIQQNMQNSIAVSLEQILTDIHALSQEDLSEEDKEKLYGKLTALSVEKTKEGKWKKVKEILKWIVDKSVEVGIAVLPYIVQTLRNTQA